MAVILAIITTTTTTTTTTIIVVVVVVVVVISSRSRILVQSLAAVSLLLEFSKIHLWFLLIDFLSFLVFLFSFKAPPPRCLW